MAKHTDYDTTKILKLALLWLTFAKLLHFIVVYEEIGFMFDMLIFCLRNLVPFTIGYVAFGLMFAIIY